MKITYRCQGGADRSTVLEAIDADTILVDGTAWRVPTDQLVTDAQGPIQSGYRDPDGALHLVVHGTYCKADAAIWETPPYRGTWEEEWVPVKIALIWPTIITTGKTQSDLDAQGVADNITALKAELAALDMIIPRSTEDLYVATGMTPYPRVAETIEQKKDLRNKINKL